MDQKQIKREIKYLETNENMTSPNLWGTSKTILRGRFIATSNYVRKNETFSIQLYTLRNQKCKTI